MPTLRGLGDALSRIAVAYLVHAGTTLDDVPDAARTEIERTMHDIAESVSTVPASSPFWSSMDDSLLQIDVSGWRVIYALDPRKQELRVLDVAQIRR